MKLKMTPDPDNDRTKWGTKRFYYTGFVFVREERGVSIIEDVSMRKPLTIIKVGGPASGLRR